IRRSVFFFSSRRRHTRFSRDWSSDVCSSDLTAHSLPANRAELCRTLVATELVQDRARLIRDLRHLGALVAETTTEGIGEAAVNRSEERRVGKECGCRGGAEH